MLQKVKPAFQLKDTSLFRQQCHIDGEWVDADSKATMDAARKAAKDAEGSAAAEENA